MDVRGPILEAALQAPPSPDYVPGPEEPEQAPPLPDYVPGPEHADDEIVAEVQPYAEDALTLYCSVNWNMSGVDLLEADPEEDDDEDPEEDLVNYPADGGDDGDDEDEPSEEDKDDDVDMEADEDEEEEEHPAPADSIVVALLAADQAPSAEETESFETDESATTPPPHPDYVVTTMISDSAPSTLHLYGLMQRLPDIHAILLHHHLHSPLVCTTFPDPSPHTPLPSLSLHYNTLSVLYPAPPPSLFVSLAIKLDVPSSDDTTPHGPYQFILHHHIVLPSTSRRKDRPELLTHLGRGRTYALCIDWVIRHDRREMLILDHRIHGRDTFETRVRQESTSKRIYSHMRRQRRLSREAWRRVRAEIEVLRRERLAYEQESMENRQALARSEAYSRALEARITVLETQARRHEWQRQDADDRATRHIMRIQALEAGARDDTLEDTGSSA
ncbi:hypothetical protein Tco_0794816 [Tanacetum coccineum]